ncbi:MAG: hypothetical protein LUD18_02005, partial [Lachnospiraceae bacterium]|nr:hypothetical protein [Lachnospiraceae bacterium]
TLYKYERILAENVFAENRDEGSFIWENWYDPGTQINEYDLTLYIRSGDESRTGEYACEDHDRYGCNDSYERYEEVHYQKAYTIDCVSGLLKEAGLQLEKVYDAFTLEQPRPESERVYFIAREIQKEHL